ncbi:MAG: iron-containing alcohol dehydrogenase [Thermoleophilia bacterium]
MLPLFFEFHNPTKVVFGPGLVADLQAELSQIGARRYLLVSDRGLEALGLPARVAASLEDAGVEVVGTFLDVPENSEVGSVRACADRALSAKADGLVALGGGSVIDTAKCADILLSEGGDLVDDHSGAGTLRRPLKPLVAIPTTAGTGSEVTRAAVILDEANKVKLSFSDTFLLPALAVLDPELTLSLPPGLTATTAMDALTHAVESYVSPQWSPVSEALAAGAVRLIFANLETAVADGSDLETRGALLVAAAMAGIAFSHAMVGCVHGMAHAVGGLYHVPHGAANAILLPHGLAYNRREIEEQLGELAPFVSGLAPDEERLAPADRVIAAIGNLTARLNAAGVLATRLRDVGVPEDGLRAVAEAAVMDGTSFYNPREVVAEEILPHLRDAY